MKKYKKYTKKLEKIMHGGNNPLTYEETKIMYGKFLDIAELLKNHYDTFWKNIFYNDAYFFYKNAILFYQNEQNNNPHGGLSQFINKKLYMGKCENMPDDDKQSFIPNNNIIQIPTNNEICNLIQQNINILDDVFDKCPKMPFNVVTYRFEYRKNTDDIMSLQVGDFYKNLNYMSTTINFFGKLSLNKWMQSLDKYEDENIYYVNFTIKLPKDSPGYFINFPFGINYNKDFGYMTGHHEYEILLQRNNIFKIESISKEKNICYIQMSLYAITIKDNYTLKAILTQKNIDKLIKKGNCRLIDNDNIFNDDMLNIRKNICDKYIKLNSTGIWNTQKQKFIEKHSLIKNNDMKNEKFIESQKNVYIKINLMYNTRLIYEIYNQLLDDDLIGKIIYFDYPSIISTELNTSIFADSDNFICKTDYSNPQNKLDGYYLPDEKYPVFILLKISNKIWYLPMGFDYGFTLDIQQLKINKMDKQALNKKYFIYILEAEIVKPLKSTNKIFHIMGASGAGKSSLGKKIKEELSKIRDIDDIILIETDDIHDRIGLELLEKNKKIPDNFNEERDKLSYNELMDIIKKNNNKIIIISGMTIHPPYDLLSGKYTIKIDSLQNYKQFNIRSLQDICNNKDKIKKIMEDNDDPEYSFRYIKTLFGIRGTFIKPIDDVQNRLEHIEKWSKDNNYLLLEPKDILKDITNKIT